MELSPKINLFADFKLTPPFYWVEVSSEYDDSQIKYQSQGNEEFVHELDENGELSLTLLVEESQDSEPYSNPVEHKVDLGELDFSGDTTIAISITANSETRGTGQVKVANAEQADRPVTRQGFKD